MRKLRAFVADECLPTAPPDGALSRYPGGAAVYAALVRQHTTTDLTPRRSTPSACANWRACAARWKR